MTTIRSRILMGMIPVTAIALAITAIWIDRAMYQDLLAAVDVRLRSLVSAVQGAVEMEPEGQLELDLSPAVQEQFEGEGGKPYYKVRGEGWESLFASSTSRTPALAAPPVQSAFLTSPGSPGYRILVASAVIEPEGDADALEEWSQKHPGVAFPKTAPRRLWVEVGLSLSGLEESRAMFRARLAPGFGVLFLVLVLVPVWVARKALRPLQSLSREAEAIQADSFGIRLTEEQVDGEVRALVRAVNRALDRLAAAHEREKRFTSDAAHELRNPLSVIRTQSEVALRKPREAPELRETLNVVQQTAVRLTKVVEGLLALSRHQSADLQLRQETVDLSELAQEAVHLLRIKAESKDIRIECRFPEPISAWGDPALLETCLLNLVENAIRFTPNGGEIRLKGNTAPSPWVSVEDNGPGISPEQQAKVFHPFYRVDPSRSRADGGTGLGLAIAQEIARSHGGQLRLSSQLGSGSRFELILPG